MDSGTLMHRSSRVAVLALLIVCAAALLFPINAHACACCTDTGQRRVATEKLSDYQRGEIARLRFAPTATLFTGAADPQDLKGLQATTSSYDLEVRRTGGDIVFAFGDNGKPSGTLSLAWPEQIAVFEVDPRTDTREGGLGPRLYKEWRLTGKLVGTGIFAPSNHDATRITLVLQGGGNSCTSAEDFTAWTLVVDGPNAAYSVLGALVPPQ